jgi:hypothetical protein
MPPERHGFRWIHPHEIHTSTGSNSCHVPFTRAIPKRRAIVTLKPITVSPALESSKKPHGPWLAKVSLAAKKCGGDSGAEADFRAFRAPTPHL